MRVSKSQLIKIFSAPIVRTNILSLARIVVTNEGGHVTFRNTQGFKFRCHFDVYGFTLLNPIDCMVDRNDVLRVLRNMKTAPKEITIDMISDNLVLNNSFGFKALSSDSTYDIEEFNTEFSIKHESNHVLRNIKNALKFYSDKKLYPIEWSKYMQLHFEYTQVNTLTALKQYYKIDITHVKDADFGDARFMIPVAFYKIFKIYDSLKYLKLYSDKEADYIQSDKFYIKHPFSKLVHNFDFSIKYPTFCNQILVDKPVLRSALKTFSDKTSNMVTSLSVFEKHLYITDYKIKDSTVIQGCDNNLVTHFETKSLEEVINCFKSNQLMIYLKYNQPMVIEGSLGEYALLLNLPM